MSMDISVRRSRRDDNRAKLSRWKSAVVPLKGGKHAAGIEPIAPLFVRADWFAERAAHDFVHGPRTGEVSVFCSRHVAGVMPNKRFCRCEYPGAQVVSWTWCRTSRTGRNVRFFPNGFVELRRNSGRNLSVGLDWKDDCVAAEEFRRIVSNLPHQ